MTRLEPARFFTAHGLARVFWGNGFTCSVGGTSASLVPEGAIQTFETRGLSFGPGFFGAAKACLHCMELQRLAAEPSLHTVLPN